jgi:hypothetical protein
MISRYRLPTPGERALPPVLYYREGSTFRVVDRGDYLGTDCGDPNVGIDPISSRPQRFKPLTSPDGISPRSVWGELDIAQLDPIARRVHGVR